MKFLTLKSDWYPHEGLRTAFANALNQPEIQVAISVLRDEAMAKSCVIPLNGVATGVAAQKQAEMAGYIACLRDFVSLAGVPPIPKKSKVLKEWEPSEQEEKS